MLWMVSETSQCIHLQISYELDALVLLNKTGCTGLNFHICVSGLSVTIRLLDPPLHEFLPEGNVEEIVRELCAETGANEEEALERVEKLAEVNPMLGFRGCRLVFCYSIHIKNQLPPLPDPFGCMFSLLF